MICLCLVTISCSLEEYIVARKHKNTTLKTKKWQHRSSRMQNIKQHTQHNNFYENFLRWQVWSCGGSMEVVPCSRVAHLSRHHLPYRFPDQELLQRNKIRVADTWMDAYRKIFYRRDTLAHFIRQVCVTAVGTGP